MFEKEFACNEGAAAAAAAATAGLFIFASAGAYDSRLLKNSQLNNHSG